MKRVRVQRHADALLVIDVQNDFCRKGSLEIPGGEEVVPAINELMPHFSHVILTQDWHPQSHQSFASAHPGSQPFEVIDCSYGKQNLWPDHCVQGTAGAAFHPLLLTHPARLILRKGMSAEIDSYSAFFENDRTTPTGLSGALKELGIRRVFLTGLATDVCVLYTALDARRLGFETVLMEDACRATALEGSEARALKEMSQAGVDRSRLHHII